MPIVFSFLLGYAVCFSLTDSIYKLIPSAERYLNVCEVTHFDISQPMIDKATELAEKEGVLDKMTFVKGALEDKLKRYGVKNIRLAGPGAYARTLPNELLVMITLFHFICNSHAMQNERG